MKRTLSFKGIVAILLFAIVCTATQAAPPAPGGKTKTIVYFLRHCEDSPELEEFDPSFSVVFEDCVEVDGELCCTEALTPLGQARAAALAVWFDSAGLTRNLTHVIASHKLRTRQTVQPIAQAAGLGGDLDGDGTLDGADVDQLPGDGVINVPGEPGECDPGFTGSSSALAPQIAYLGTLPVGSRAVVCTHSPVMYPLMEAFGIDTSDPVLYPRNARGRVSGFNNLWIVELTRTTVDGNTFYQGRLLNKVLVDLGIDVTSFDPTAGLH